MKPRKLELLSPAGNAEIARQAILHGADAVYIGPPSHGARKSASNSLEDIEKVVDFAHQYRAKVYATVNTIIYDQELKAVESLIKDLYRIGVDALIVQDMGILRMKIPPISLHASTQCDIRTPQKARFLEEVGFSQIVLARELTLEEIKAITKEVSIPVETFVHGALCVSYSGRCHASFALNGRSANRGECAQICRYPFTLTDSEGKEIIKDKYLLSLKDFNASHNLADLIDAGVSSFKIEGRLKEAGYVKNITALYNRQLLDIIASSEGKYTKSSFGEFYLNFTPKADKSFNRGFTNYFLESRKPFKIASMLTPKSQGEQIKKTSELNNGDGISFYNNEGEFTGVNINKIEKGKIIPARKVDIPHNANIYRTSDIKWDKIMASETAKRKIPLDVTMTPNGVTGYDQRGVLARLLMNVAYQPSRNPMDYRGIFEKLGNTIYQLNNFISTEIEDRFYRASELAELRRKLVSLLDKANNATYAFEYRRKENISYPYPSESLDYRDNVANHLAEEFYKSHGVKKLDKAAEVSGKMKSKDIVMTTRHCILRELGMCKKEGLGKRGNKENHSHSNKSQINEIKKWKPENLKFPLYLNYSGGKFLLDFDCNSCEMQVKLP